MLRKFGLHDLKNNCRLVMRQRSEEKLNWKEVRSHLQEHKTRCFTILFPLWILRLQLFRFILIGFTFSRHLFLFSFTTLLFICFIRCRHHWWYQLFAHCRWLPQIVQIKNQSKIAYGSIDLPDAYQSFMGVDFKSMFYFLNVERSLSFTS